MHSRSLMGTPSNLSKKGGLAIGTVRQQTDGQREMMMNGIKLPVEPTSESMVGKRTEWLEVQERRLTASIQDHKNEQDKLKVHVKAVEDKSEAQAMQLFQDTQWMYGWTAAELYGIEAPEGKLHNTLNSYRTTMQTTLCLLSPVARWVLLSYPMEQVVKNDGAVEMLMKMRTVDADTGQPKVCWALIATRAPTGECQRVIGEFSVAPYAK